MTSLKIKPGYKLSTRSRFVVLRRLFAAVTLATTLVIAVSKAGEKQDWNTLLRVTSFGNQISHASKTWEPISGLQKSSYHGVEYLWQLPKIGTQTKGILFVAHGCSHGKEDWWPLTEDVCGDCIGLPEEKAIVGVARDLGLAVVAMSSTDRMSGCWSNADGPIVAETLLHIRGKMSSDIPMFAFGASSGGFFVAKHLPEALSLTSKLDGFICQISATRFRSGDPIPSALAIPSVFITMNRDKRTQALAANTVEAYSNAGVPSLHIRLPQREIVADYFSKRIPDSYDNEASAKIVMALSNAGFLGSDKMLKDDPRQTNWREVIRPHAAESDKLVPDASPISEVLNVAFAMHEIARDEIREALEFLMTNRTPRVNE